VVVAASSFHIFGDYHSGLVNVSTNSGATWSVANLPGENWASVAASADGKRLFAAAAGIPAGSPVTYIIPRPIYVSSDWGATWSPAPSLHAWRSVACSADGAAVIAVGTFISADLMPSNSVIYTSSDAGLSWDLDIAQGTWEAVTSSADGGRVVGTTSEEGQILTRAQVVVPPRLTIAITDEQAFLSWLTPSALFVLQQTPSLAQPDWTEADAQPTLNYTNLNQEIALPAPCSSVFYRLVSR